MAVKEMYDLTGKTAVVIGGGRVGMWRGGVGSAICFRPFRLPVPR